MAKPKGNRPRSGARDVPPLNHEQRRILEWLRKLRFKKRIFGGVSERDVWKRIEELNNMYNAALNAERARYDALIEQQRHSANTVDFDNGGEQP